jgi:hypothetical protein
MKSFVSNVLRSAKWICKCPHALQKMAIQHHSAFDNLPVYLVGVNQVSQHRMVQRVRAESDPPRCFHFPNLSPGERAKRPIAHTIWGRDGERLSDLLEKRLALCN